METVKVFNKFTPPVRNQPVRSAGPMKLFYTILFFLNTLFLIALTFLFLGFLDTGKSPFTMAGIVLAIVLCIVMLGYFLAHYMKIPPSDNP